MDGLAVNCEQIAGLKVDVDRVLLGTEIQSPEQLERLRRLRSETQADPSARMKYRAAYEATVVGEKKLTDAEIAGLKSTCRDLQNMNLNPGSGR